MSWFQKFIHLLYVAYLDCEELLRVFAFLVIGIVTGLFIFILAVEYLPPMYDLLSLVLVSITLWNIGILLLLGFQYSVSIIICWSMIKVAYIYDDKSWGYVHDMDNSMKVLDNQLTVDKIKKLEQDKKHDEMIKEKVAKIKES